VKLEYRQMGLSAEQAERYAAAKELLEKTLRRFDTEAGSVLRSCCPVHAIFFQTFKQSCEFVLHHGGEMVVLKKVTYGELEAQIANSIKLMEAIISDVSGAKNEQDAHKAIEGDPLVKVNMSAPQYKN
jgi:hypothetical protein